MERAKYAEKADAREGGVGDETTIITPDVYSNAANTKFIPIVAERDDAGMALMPSYLKARIYIDLCSEQVYFDGYEKLLRVLHGEPANPKPALGKKPSHLAEGATTGSTTLPLLKRAIAALEQDKRSGLALAQDHLEAVVESIAGLRVVMSGPEPIDDRVADAIARSKAMRDEVLDLLEILCRSAPPEKTEPLIHQALEKLLSACFHQQEGGVFPEAENDAVRFVTMELFLYVVSVLLVRDELDVLGALLQETFVYREDFGEQKVKKYRAFRFPIASIDEDRNRRLRLNKMSLVAELLRERADRKSVPFRQLQEVEFLLFLRLRYEGKTGWYPRTLVYLSDNAPPFPAFLGLDSPRRAKRLVAILGIGNIEEIRNRFEAVFPDESSRFIRFGPNPWPPSIARLMNIDLGES